VAVEPLAVGGSAPELIVQARRWADSASRAAVPGRVPLRRRLAVSSPHQQGRPLEADRREPMLTESLEFL
jgi:hypothetical protein